MNISLVLSCCIRYWYCLLIYALVQKLFTLRIDLIMHMRCKHYTIILSFWHNLTNCVIFVHIHDVAFPALYGEFESITNEFVWKVSSILFKTTKLYCLLFLLNLMSAVKDYVCVCLWQIVIGMNFVHVNKSICIACTI